MQEIEQETEVKKEKKPLLVQVVFFLLMIIAGAVFCPLLVVLIIGVAFCAIVPACAYFFFSYLKERNYNNCKLKTNKNYCISEKMKKSSKE